jgi:predicted enzyme related to lactoylglutathione lyase
MAKFLATAAVMALGLTATLRAAPFPAINSSASNTVLPGKLVWADLFTSQPTEATKFYCDLLGWTSTTIDQKGKTYTIFTNDGVAVAGLAPHSYAKESHPSRWIGYISVADINATVAAVEKNGGTVHAPAKKFPDRGFQAIVADSDGNPIGLLQSSSGDPADDETRAGAWNWFELYVKNPQATTNFYHQALSFDVAPETKSDRKSDFVLSSNGNARGGVAPIPEEAKEGKPRWLGVIRVADLDQTLAKVAGLGGEVLVAPHSAEYGSRFAIILDSTGGTLGLVQYIESANPAKSP